MSEGASVVGQRPLDGLAVDEMPLVGREAELDQLTRLLIRARLVTVMGPGGVGKTILAFRAASSAAAGFAGSVCVTRLSDLNDPELLPHTVAARLGLAGQDSRPATDLVLDYLRDRELLLVLDTCEHLIDACAELVEALLQQAPRVTVLATSRQPLDVDGERVFPLSPLSVPEAGGMPGPGDATDLFARRAAAAAGTFAVTAENRRDVVTVCERLDGIPLAIELAAVRLRTLSVADLARLLTDRLAIPGRPEAQVSRLPQATGGRAAAGSRLATMADPSQAEARHRTLRAAIGWSYDLCTPAEQALWERLSVFAGSFGLDAAGEVCAGRGLPGERVAETVVGLVDKSVLIRDEPGGVGPSRYRFLDTLREFGAERLAASGAETGVQDRFIARYRDRARYLGDHFLDDDQLERLRDLAGEHTNIRAALEYTLDSAQPGRWRDGAELASDLYGYWLASSRLREGGYWLGKVLEKFPGKTRERARALVVRSYISAFEGAIGKAAGAARDGIAIATELGDEFVQGRGYLYLNLALTFGGRWAEAAEAGAETERLLDRAGDHIGLLCLHGQLAHMYQLSGDLDAASRHYNQAMRRFGDTRERWLSGYMHIIAGMSLFQQPGRESACAAAASRALLAKHEIGDIVGIAYALELLAWLASRDGRHGRCAWLLGAAAALWERAGGRLSNTEALEQSHQQSAQAARAVLGDQQFDVLYTEGRRYPRDGIVQCAVGNADDLPRILPPAR